MILGLLALAALAWYLLSRNNTDDTATVRADSTAVAAGAVTTDSASGAMAGGMSAGGAGMSAGTATGGANATGTLSDADITNVIHEVNAGEIAAGEMAADKASNGQVKAFAREMVQAHRAMDQKGAKLATATGAASQGALRDSVVSANTAMASQLQNAGSGADFDRAYLDGQVAAHQNTLAFLQRAQSQAQNAELKSMIDGAIPDVQKHLERARALQARVSGGQ
jgi:putative membrane protein